MSESTSKFDLSFLNKISGGDPVFIREMVTTFKEMTPDFITNAKLFYENLDYKSLSQEAHKYVPGVSFLGMKDLERDLALIEEYAKKEINLEQLPSLLESAYCQINEIIDILSKEFNLE